MREETKQYLTALREKQQAMSRFHLAGRWNRKPVLAVNNAKIAINWRDYPATK